MKKFYQSPQVEVLDVTLVDCLSLSQSVLPENPIPDISDDGFNFEF